jgi:hypothetical protein
MMKKVKSSVKQPGLGFRFRGDSDAKGGSSVSGKYPYEAGMHQNRDERATPPLSFLGAVFNEAWDL